MRGIDWFRLENGKIAEAWIELDELGTPAVVERSSDT